MAVPSIDFLSRYLEQEPFGDDPFPWNKLTCFVVVCYVLKKKHVSSDTISSLDSTAKEYLDAENRCRQLTHRKPEDVSEMKNVIQDISLLFVNSFIPEAKMHFTVPKIEDLSDKDENLQENEILAGFLDFLVQVLHREANVDKVREQRYVSLKEELLFLLAVLGDKPFDCNPQHSVLEEQVKDVLAKFSALANEAGNFIYSYVFPICSVEDEAFNAERNALLEKFPILNTTIKELCIKFSELPIDDVPCSNVGDSFFIIHSLVDDLDNFSPHEFLSVKDHILLLHDELRTLQIVLKFTDASQDDGVMKGYLGQIRDLAYEAEYLINSHVVGNIHAWYLDLRLLSITQKITLARERLEQIKELHPCQVMVHNGGETSDVTPATVGDDNHFVELQQNMTERILADLVGKPKSPRQTISIFGMPGLGKTTIANKLYGSVSRYFDRRAWCVVSQTYSVRSLMVNILTNTARELKIDQILKKSDAELGVDIHKSLKQRRYLIVLDDVWDSNAWYALQRYLPDDRNGSRVVLTSRIKDAAPDGSIYHRLPLFSDDQCWDLLEKKIFQGKSCPPELLRVGKGIASKCSGIPLAVIITAGILANMTMEEDEWERVETQLDSFLLDGLSNYRKILELSYEHLPHNMKPCFLYFAAFPEDAEIPVNKLAWRWIAEGFIRKNEGKSREQIAELYLSELMNRSLVIPEKRGSDGRIKTCRIHDLLRDICIMKANEENFLNSNNESSIYEKHQRSYLPFTSNTDLRPFGLHCRSLIGGLPDRSSCFQTRALLKVLDIMPNKFQKFANSSFNLPIQLRYLGVNHLPNIMVANLDNLEFINVVNSSQIKVPAIILRKKKLRHLIVRKEAIFEEDDYISETTGLRTLFYVCIYKRPYETILRYSPKLQKLKCRVSDKTVFPDFSFLEELETLKIVFKVSSFSFTKVSNLSFPSTIKKLCLWNANLPWKKMSVVGRLPHLCVLKLENQTGVGLEWETVDGEFEELRFLKIERTDLERWTSYSEHFPKLEKLVLDSCGELVEIPCDFGNIVTLQIIEVIHCLISASLSAVQIEQEQRECGNEDLRVNITTFYWTKEELVALYREKMEITENVLVEHQMYPLSSIICTPERDFLVDNDGKQIKVDSLKGKTVGIYFSDFRLKSSRLFTQKLVKVYNELKKYDHFEIVYVSGDQDINNKFFNLDFSKLPWLAIPSTDSDTRNKLDELFHVQRIPYLVILDENWKVLTEEGVRILEENGGKGYPFVPERIQKSKQVNNTENDWITQPRENEDTWNDSLGYLLVSRHLDFVIHNDGTKIPISRLLGKTTLLFFATNNLVCRKFLPKLIQAYHEINMKYKNSLEVIFISRDDNRFSFKEFFAMMPWLALPFHDDREGSLLRLYKVKALPRVVIIGPTGKAVMSDGGDLLKLYGAEAYPFTSQRVKEIKARNDSMAQFSWPKKVTKEVHEHELCLLKHKKDYICDGCDEFGTDWTYQCIICKFYLHPMCALSNANKVEISESWQKVVDELEEPEEEVRNNCLEFLLVNKSRDYVIDFVERKIPVSDLVRKTTILFFAASWCLRSQFILPELIHMYQKNNDKFNNSVEVIFISNDKNQLAFDMFFAKMPWLALPFGDDRIEHLSRRFKVKGIPMLVTIEPGMTVTNEAWELISYPGSNFPFPYEWVKEIHELGILRKTLHDLKVKIKPDSIKSCIVVLVVVILILCVFWTKFKEPVERDAWPKKYRDFQYRF